MSIHSRVMAACSLACVAALALAGCGDDQRPAAADSPGYPASVNGAQRLVQAMSSGQASLTLSVPTTATQRGGAVWASCTGAPKGTYMIVLMPGRKVGGYHSDWAVPCTPTAPTGAAATDGHRRWAWGVPAAQAGKPADVRVALAKDAGVDEEMEWELWKPLEDASGVTIRAAAYASVPLRDNVAAELDVRGHHYELISKHSASDGRPVRVTVDARRTPILVGYVDQPLENRVLRDGRPISPKGAYLGGNVYGTTIESSGRHTYTVTPRPAARQDSTAGPTYTPYGFALYRQVD